MGMSTHTQIHTYTVPEFTNAFFPFKQATMSRMSVALKAVIYLFNDNRDKANRRGLNE